MYESTNIFYNGVSSSSLGLLFVKFNNQDNSEVFLTDRNVISDRIQKNNSHKSQSYIYGVKREQRKFTAEFYCDAFTEAKKSQVAKWLDTGTFAPFYSDDNVEKIYYCTMSGSPKFVTNGTQGIVSVDMICQDEYSYSTLKTNTYDYSLTSGVQTATITNSGDVKTSPVIILTVVGVDHSVIIQNQSNYNQTLTMQTDTSGNQLLDTEIITIDCNKEIITTDRLGVLRYDNMVGNFLDFALGVNTIKVTGNCKLTFKHQNKFLT